MSFADRLRRRTTSEKYIPGIDGLRFAAIATVVLLHVFTQNQRATVPYGLDALPQHPAYYLFMRIVLHGMRGVPIFFAISGFILALPFARQHFHQSGTVSLRSYFLRRLTRLEPPYLAVLLLRLPLLLLFAPNPQAHYVRHFLASAFYLHNLVYGTSSLINPPAWSLEIEIQFYCLVPLLAWYFAVRNPALRRVGLVAVMLLLGYLELHFLDYNGRSGLSILYWLQFFLAGFLVADLYLTDWQRIPAHWLWELTLPLWFWIFLSDRSWFHMAMPFAIVLLFVAAFKAPIQRRFFSSAPISIVGGMCYSLYLTHSLVLTGLAQLANHLHWHLPVAAAWLACTATALLLGTLFYMLIEKPCMDPNWPQKLRLLLFPVAVETAEPSV